MKSNVTHNLTVNRLRLLSCETIIATKGGKKTVDEIWSELEFLDNDFQRNNWLKQNVLGSNIIKLFTKFWREGKEWLCMTCDHFTVNTQNYCAGCGRLKGECVN